MSTDYAKDYTEFWQHLVENEDGSLNKDQVMRELFDYRLVMDNASEVYCELAGLSKPNTAAQHIIDGAERKFREYHAADILNDLLDEMGTEADRQAVIDFANRMSPGAYERHTIKSR